MPSIAAKPRVTSLAPQFLVDDLQRAIAGGEKGGEKGTSRIFLRAARSGRVNREYSGCPLFGPREICASRLTRRRDPCKDRKMGHPE